MGARTFIQSAKRLFHVAQKPDWEETALLIKISLLGVGIVGGIGFVIRILFWLVGLYNLPASHSPTPTGGLEKEPSTWQLRRIKHRFTQNALRAARNKQSSTQWPFEHHRKMCQSFPF